MYTAENYPEILDSIETNTDMIYVYDNALDRSELAALNSYNWSLRDWTAYCRWPNPIVEKETPLGDILCNRMVSYLKKIDKDLEVIEHIGSYYVLRDKTNEHLDDNIHRDFYNYENVWSAVFHVIGKHGPTIFYPNFQSDNPILNIDFLPGRLILFPSLYAHKAGNTIPGKIRLTHTIRLLLKSRILNYTAKTY